MKNSPAAPKDRPYKSSGNDWTGKIPVTWTMQRVKSLLRERNERGHTSEPLLSATQSQGVVLKEKYDNRTVLPSNEVDQFKLVREGDFVISLRSFQGGIEYAYDQGIISPAYTVIYPYNPLNDDYFARLFKSRPFVQNLAICVTGIREGQNIDYARLQIQTIPVPPLVEQTAIVRFLDHADEQIQLYIAGKEQFIALLEEDRQALIHQTVTRGLDPSVRLRPSGVEWLGEIPEHWEVTAVRHRYSQSLGKMLDTKSITGDHLLPYLRNTDVQWDRINVEDLPSMDIPTSQYDQYTVQQGDLLVCEGGEVGRTALWSGQLTRCGFQKALHRLRPKNSEQDMPRFMYYALRSAAKGHAFSDGHVSTIAHLTGEKLRAHRFPFPSLAEQAALVERLDKETANIDATIVRARRQIDLMNEYRTRLIADVVTGQLDVREAALDLPTGGLGQQDAG